MLVKKEDSHTNKPLEKDIQREILEWLDTQEMKYPLMFWRQNNGSVFGRNNAGNMAFRSRGKFVPKGIPDIWVVTCGRLIGFEVKRPGGVVREEQKEFGSKLVNHGGYYFIVKSLQDVKEIMTRLI